MKENWKIIKNGIIIKHVHSCCVTWDSGGKTLLLFLCSTPGLILLLCITQHRPNSRLLQCYLLQDPATVCALGSCYSWCQMSGHWHASVALMAFGKGQPISICGYESRPLTNVSPVAALLWYKAAVELRLLNRPRAAQVTPTFWVALKDLFGCICKWYTICFAICCLCARCLF